MAESTFVTERPPNAINLNISDVIEMINDDYGGGGGLMYGGGAGDGGRPQNSAPSEAEYSMSTATTTVDPMQHVKQKAFVRIIEQPQSKALRFRYICEGRSAGSIPGLRSTAENKTYPAIEVVGYTGPAAVVVSCVTVDPPHRPHPHNLVGKDGCKKGICTMTINSESMQCVFSNLGIQCVKKRDVEDALKLREEIRVDPYKTGFGHRNQPQSIDLNALRLCFQVFVEGQVKGKMTVPLAPVVSQPIYDKKAACDLLICKLSDCTSSVAGGKEIILLCDKVTKEDIQVRFYEVTDGQISWEALADFQPSDVHKQVAISFKTPRYKTIEVENPVKVYIQLQRPSDKTTSESRQFEYLPLDSDADYVRRKIARIGNASNTQHIGRFLAENIPQSRGLEGLDVPRPRVVAARSVRNSSGVKIENIEPPDGLVGSPLSPGGGALGSLSPKQEAAWIRKMSPQHYNTGCSSDASSVYHPSPTHLPPHQHLYYMQPGTPTPPPPSHSPYGTEHPGGAVAVSSSAGSERSFSMVLDSGAGGIVTVTSPVLSPHATPQGPGNPEMQILDLESPRYNLEQHQLPPGGAPGTLQHHHHHPHHHHLQHHHLQHLMPQIVSNSDLDMNQINSAELRLLMNSESDMTGPFVEAHLSENLSSNLNIIDPNPVLPQHSAASAVNNTNISNPLDNNLNNPLGQLAGGSSYLPNIVGAVAVTSDVTMASRSEMSTCDSLNTPTPSSDSLAQLTSDLELLNNAMG